MHIALIGLSGDPTHLGHLEVARTVHALGYTRVWFMLTPQNPFKEAAEVPYWHRRELTRLLIQGEEHWLEVSDFEAGVAVLDPDTRTHTMLTALKANMPEASFTFVMGADAWADDAKGFHTWKNSADIPNLASLLVLPRDPWTAQITTCKAAQTLADKQAEGSRPIPPGHWGVGPRVVHVASSSAVRDSLHTGADTPYLTASQKAYIHHHGLYA